MPWLIRLTITLCWCVRNYKIIKKLSIYYLLAYLLFHFVQSHSVIVNISQRQEVTKGGVSQQTLRHAPQEILHNTHTIDYLNYHVM